MTKTNPMNLKKVGIILVIIMVWISFFIVFTAINELKDVKTTYVTTRQIVLNSLTFAGMMLVALGIVLLLTRKKDNYDSKK